MLEDLEAERAITFFATSLIDQRTIDEVLWDVAKNCIARLHFVDCVVYWLDAERNVLVQKAAHGPKNPEDFTIYQPLEIPLGQGIVGTVARTGRAELIQDTSKDGRYIQDDAQRYAEIAVPIISEGRVLGVIDAEHPKKNFFQPRHLKILVTIAALCAQKIRRVQVDEAYRQAEWQLLEMNKRMAETKLMALRMQMNPHFIFNSLSSINAFILQNDADHASAFLTKFSRLMRQVLDNSQTEWVSLRNELKALQIYIELEQLRCETKFDVSFNVSPDLDQDAVRVPPMITHPYVENAIWHGLLPKKEGTLLLKIDCWQEAETLLVQIDDNGIGRSAAPLQTQELTTHKLHGIQLTGERLSLINVMYAADARVAIIDLQHEDQSPAGTRVVFSIKLNLPFEKS